MTTDAAAALLPGFSDYGQDANHVFRTCLDATARPGTVYSLDVDLSTPAPLLPSSAALLLALADYETTCWLDPTLANARGVAEYVRFHTGARISSTPDEADFAVAADVRAMPRISSFKQGTPEFPDRSTTLILQVESIKADGFQFAGPGINGVSTVSCDPTPSDFQTQWRENRSAFPCGVDLIFVAATHIAALPRSAALIGEA